MVYTTIMQPTYLPWVGYFDLIDQADDFVFLDDVQFSRQSWQQRNRIRASDGLQWLTVPVQGSGKSRQRICDCLVADDQKFPDRHLRAIEHSYRRSPYWGEYGERLLNEVEEAAQSENLASLNAKLIRWLAETLGIGVRFWRSSEMGIPQAVGRVQRLVQIVQRTSSLAYLTVPGSLGYLEHGSGQFAEASIRVFTQKFDHPEWTQLHEPFIPQASVIDLIFAEGPSALEIIRSGRGKPIVFI